MKPNILSGSSKKSKIRNFYYDNSALALNTMPEVNEVLSKKIVGYVPEGRHSASSVVVNNKIYIIGGFTSGINSSTTKFLEFDPTTNQWSNKQNLPTGFANGGASVVNGKIYVISGLTANGSVSTSDKVYEYNFDTDTWSSKAVIPTGRYNFATESFNNKIYIFGGNTNSGASTSGISEYDVSTNTWVYSKASLPTVKVGASANLFNNKIYIFGGISDPITIDVYEPGATSASLHQSYLYSFYRDMASTVLNGKIYISGGVYTSTNTLSSMIEYDAVAKKDTTKSINIGIPRTKHNMVAVNNKLYIMNGYNGTDTYHTEIIEYKINTEKTSLILDYVEVGEKIFSYQYCKVGETIIEPNILTTINTPGYLSYLSSDDVLSGYIVSK